MILGNKKHVYDVDLKEIFKQYRSGIQEVNITSYHPKQYHIDQVRVNMENFCHSKKVDFDLTPIIIVNENDNDSYWHYLALFIVFLRPEKINLLLEHHIKNFSGTRKDFINAVEFVVLDGVQFASIFDNSIRINKISKWIEQKKKIFRKETVHPIWKSEYYTKLKALSKELFDKKYTKRNDDFHDVFTNRKIITWKQTPESLIYLLDKLRTSPTEYITTTKGNHPFFKAIEGHFRFSDKENQLIFRNDLRKVLDNMMRVSIEKFKIVRQEVDQIITSIK